MPRIPAIVITVTHSLFGCDHWVTTDFIIAVLKKLRCLNCLSNVAQVCNNDKAASSVKIRLDSQNNLRLTFHNSAGLLGWVTISVRPGDECGDS